jgi:predicted MFS family arabinose efflux permease
MSVHTDAPEVPRATVVAVVAATTIAQMTSVMAGAVFPVIAPKLAVELGVTSSTIGYQISIIYGVAMLLTTTTSAMIARYGACRMTQISLFSCAAAMAFAVSANIAALVIASILIGVGMSVMTPASAHLLFRFSPARRRNLIFSIKQTGVPLGWVLLALTAPAITLALGWRWALVFVGVLCLAMAALLQRVRPVWDDDRARRVSAKQPFFAGLGVLWHAPALRWLSAASFCLAFVQLCVGSFLVIMLVEEAGYTLVQAGLLLSLVQISGVVGRIIWGWFADRSGKGILVLFLLTAGMVVCCVLTACITPGWPVSALALLCIAFGATAVGWNGIFLAEVARHSPRGMVGVATGGAMVWNFGGILVGPACFATVYKATADYTTTYGWLTVIALFGVAFMYAALKTRPAAKTAL